jgi:hypothetical protein
MDDWVNKEFANLDLGDKRLNRRADAVLRTLMRDPESSLLKAFQSRAELAGVYRLLANEQVDTKGFVQCHGSETLTRSSAYERVLCLSDTTFISYPHRSLIDGMGPFNKRSDNGFFLHVDFAVSDSGVCLGTLNWQDYVRDPALNKRKTQAKRPVEEKENQRWINSCEAVNTAQKELVEQGVVTRLCYVTDREGDFYELLACAAGGSADYLIRARSTRLLPSGLHIGERPEESARVGSVNFDMPAQRGVKPRNVTQSVYSQRVSISARRGKERTLPVEMTVLWLMEDKAPEGQSPLNWILLSNLPVTTIEEARTLVDWYRLRWRIEMLFDVLKNTCQVERLQLRTPEGIKKLCALYLIVSWRILYLMTLSRECPELPATTCFAEDELKLLTSSQVLWSRKRLPAPQTLGQAVCALARLGGYLARKNDKPPGHRTLTFALLRLFDIALFQRLQS